MNFKPQPLIFLCLLSGCSWWGVERLKAEEKSVAEAYVSNIYGDKTNTTKITIGTSKDEVIKTLGSPISTYAEGDFEILKYPSTLEVKSGSVIIIGLIPIPAYSAEKSDYKFYFSGNTLVKISTLATKGGFHGVYIDGSGSGVLNGEQSKSGLSDY